MRAIAVSVCALAAALAIAAPADAKARFKVTGVEVATAEASVGAPLQASVSIRNAAKHRRRAQLRLFFRGADADIAVGAQRTARLGKDTIDVTSSVPAVTPGAYVLVACVPKRGNHGPFRCGSDAVTVTGTSTTPPTFTPGARTLDDPLLPQIGNGGYDASHYAIDLDYDPAANTFTRAVTTMTATATQDLSELSLDFQKLPVDAVLVNGAAATFSQPDATPVLAGGGTQPQKLVITPAAGIVNGSSFTVEVRYHGAPQVFTDPDGSPEGWIPNPVTCPGAGCSYFVVGEPMGSQAWFPSNNHPSDKATFDTQIEVPSGDTALGVGQLTSRVDDGTTATWNWNENSPTATYLVTASVAPTPAPGQFTQGSITEGLTGRSLPIYDTVATSAMPALAGIVALTSQDKSMIDILGAHYGAYPLGSYGSFWDENPDVGYELEVQTKSHFSTAPVAPGTYLHELSHQWWGDSVGPHDWNDLWHNEGWAQLSEWIWGQDSGTDPTTPEQHFDQEYNGASASDWSVAPATLDGDPAKMFSTFPTYTRGAMVLEGYREIIGASAFDEFARALQTQYGHGTIDTSQFIVLAEQASGFSGANLARLDQYFQQWLYGTQKPTITPADF